MPRGKKQHSRPSAGGIVRNSHHRPNRKANKSMHKHSHGHNSGEVYRPDVPVFEFDDLCLAVRGWTQKNIEGFDETKFDKELERYCVNYLRHHHSDYDLERKKRGVWAEKKAAYWDATEKVFHAIAEAYPWLAAECDRQLMARRLGRGKARIIKQKEWLARQVRLFNTRQEGQLTSVQEAVADVPDGFFGLNGGLCSLASERFLFLPPFLPREEIRWRRFGRDNPNMNDHWWEWEQELGLATVEGRSRVIRANGK